MGDQHRDGQQFRAEPRGVARRRLPEFRFGECRLHPRRGNRDGTRASLVANKGTGVDLALARRIVVNRHDGSISVDSEPGNTTFHVRLAFTQSATRHFVAVCQG